MKVNVVVACGYGSADCSYCLAQIRYWDRAGLSVQRPVDGADGRWSHGQQNAYLLAASMDADYVLQLACDVVIDELGLPALTQSLAAAPSGHAGVAPWLTAAGQAKHPLQDLVGRASLDIAQPFSGLEDHSCSLQHAECLLLRASLVREVLAALDSQSKDLLSELRTRGYRLWVTDRVNARVSSPRALSCVVDPATWQNRLRVGSDAARAISSRTVPEPSITVDLRGSKPFHNGTTRLGVTLASELVRIAPDRVSSVVCDEDTAQFHGLNERLGEVVTTRMGERPADIAIRLDQPWAITDLVSLHTAADAVVVFMLDIIAWDCELVPTETGVSWALTGSLVDGIVFLSSEVRASFMDRFGCESDVPTLVLPASLDVADYRLAHESTDARTTNRLPQVLVMGNGYLHKEVHATVERLRYCYPSLYVGSVEDLGAGGSVGDGILRDAMRNALAVVFPSHMEGFGLPVMEAASEGVPVVARRMPSNELIASALGSHAMTLYRDTTEMVDAVGAAIRRPRPIQVTTSDWTWGTATEELLEFSIACHRSRTRRRWTMREAVSVWSQCTP
jgi:glycosyltransferase involved in cell wall biosynthesis